MASAKFLEEALSTDVDESVVSAIVGSLETQLVTSAPHVSSQSGSSIVINHNHLNSGISNGGTVVRQKLGTSANDDSMDVVSTDTNDQVINNAMQMSSGQVQSVGGTVTTNYIQQNPNSIDTTNKCNEGVRVVYSQGNQTISSAGAIMTNRVAVSGQSLPNGTIGISPHQVLQTSSNIQTLQNKQPTLVIKTSGAPVGTPGLVTVPMNVTSSVPQANNVVNVRPGVSTAQKGQPARVVLSSPQIVGPRPGPAQITLQSFHGLQPGQQGHLLLKTENGQYQLLRVGPAPASANIAGNSTPGGQPVTFRMQTVAQPAATTTVATTPNQQAPGTITVTSTGQIAVQTVQRTANDNTKEKCRKFLANLLELSSREPKAVERNVRTLIQELIDMKVEPEDFCDKLERLLNASPQPCLIGFLKKSLPLLRHSLATKELSIEGIRPPPSNLVYSVSNATGTVQTQIRPGIASNPVRIVAPGTTVVRGANQVLQPRLVTPIRGQTATRMVTAIRQPSASNNVIVTNSQPPALHPVYPNNAQLRPAVVRQPLQKIGVSTIRQPITVRTAVPANKMQGIKPSVPSMSSRPTTKDKEKNSFSTYAGDDDINDVAAMGGVNLAEETQKILGSTEFVGTQIRSCKEELMCSMGPLQQKIKQVMMRHGLEEPNTDVAACISHAAQEKLKNLLEKLAIVSEHRADIIKTERRYEASNDIKGQLKFLEEVDRAERKRHEELEREMLLRAAKSRSKTEDPEQAKLKAKAKEMQRVEMEEMRQREANATALKAIGPRKKPRLDTDSQQNGLQNNLNGGSNFRAGQPLRQRMKKIALRDVQFLFETEKELCRSKLLFKSYLK
ncbi:transcription initiation factor TFIID subunit 4 isoform X2 [Coccinella septempunctata]|uniref:transcription initiation factor TFIID subunit 4 isoform X2 n=1 Tax=Coccinella septempunctata TaxID=41139 RepID=UPI001D095D66|nr:transcription initiation factor TFIID subunit 4 isoform X2 [Coccinella septempunctata]